MEKDNGVGQSLFIYDEQGAGSISQQITDAYNSGVIDKENGQFDMEKYNNNQALILDENE